MKLPGAPQRTTPGFAFSMMDRALRDCLGKRQFGKNEMAQVLEFFGADPPECAYCGSKQVKRWDHIVPIRRGGETVLGNMVLACGRCDDSKQHLPLEEWMRSDAKSSPRSRGVLDIEHRMAGIHAYMHHFGYSARSLEDRLDEQELDRLADIRLRLAGLRRDVDALIEDYRAKR